ncbi:MAG TPA: FtsQ-type POTRA domain-containing protein [Bacillota bacterium]|nr:FtsQ-type POTRA domain-containing protein [Bacillota bacterium]
MRKQARVHNLQLITKSNKPAPKKRWVKAGRRALIIAASLLLLKMGHALFTVKNIEVKGPAFLDREALIERSGITVGSSIFTVRSDKVAHALQADPAILEAAVQKDYPSTVVISVTSRTPVAYILAEGGCWLMDAEGIVYKQDAEMSGNLPVVTGINPDHLFPGEVVRDQASAMALHAFFSALAEVPHLKPAELNLADSREMVLYTASGLKVLLGDSKNMRRKLALVKETLPYLPEVGDFACLDVRTGERLIVVGKL